VLEGALSFIIQMVFTILGLFGSAIKTALGILGETIREFKKMI